MTRDTRYQFVRCSKCGATWQNIDFGCSAHRVACLEVDVAERMAVDQRDYPADVYHGPAS